MRERPIGDRLLASLRAHDGLANTRELVDSSGLKPRQAQEALLALACAGVIRQCGQDDGVGRPSVWALPAGR